jgi:hypothetical protein
MLQGALIPTKNGEDVPKSTLVKSEFTQVVKGGNIHGVVVKISSTVR